MTMALSLQGTLLACVRNEYRSFTDEAGATKPGGTSYRLWVSQDFGQDPCRVNLRVDQLAVFEALEQEGLGAVVQLSVTPGDKGAVRLIAVLSAAGKRSAGTAARAA